MTELQECPTIQEHNLKNTLSFEKKVSADELIAEYDNNPVLLKLYSIYDDRAKMYSGPIISQSDDVIKRNLKMDIQKNELYKQNSDDFHLYRVGYINTLNGQLLSLSYKVIDFTELLNTDNYKL